MRLRFLLATGAVLVSFGCYADSPLWQLDDYQVQGELHGRTCTGTLDGDSLAFGEFHRDSIFVNQDHAHNIGLADGLGLKAISCRGLVVHFSGPTGVLPSPRRYPISRAFVSSSDSASASYYEAPVDPGAWPFAQAGAYLSAASGHVLLDSIRIDSTLVPGTHYRTDYRTARVYGRFSLRMRRKAG